MASAGPRYPGSAANLSNAGTSENTDAWTNPTNVSSDNATESTIVAASYDSPDISQILVASNFGFSADIPSGSTIDGITVEIDRRSIVANSGKDFRVQLATGTTFADLVGTNKAVPATIWPTTSTVATYGGSADTWSAGLTAAQVNATGFAVFLSAQANIANADIGVDYIRVTINYTAPAPSGTGAITVPSATVAGTGVLTLTGTGAISVPSATVSGTGAEEFTATGAISVPSATVAGIGEEVFTATGALSVPAPTVAGDGTHTGGGPEPVTGTGAITVPSATVTGTGAETFTATGAISVPASTVSGTGAEVLTATGAVVVPSPSVAGSGLHSQPVTGTGAIVIPAATVAATGSTDSATDGGGSGRRRRPIPTRRPLPVQETDPDETFVLFL